MVLIHSQNYKECVCWSRGGGQWLLKMLGCRESATELLQLLQNKLQSLETTARGEIKGIPRLKRSTGNLQGLVLLTLLLNCWLQSLFLISLQDVGTEVTPGMFCCSSSPSACDTMLVPPAR